MKRKITSTLFAVITILLVTISAHAQSTAASNVWVAARFLGYDATNAGGDLNFAVNNNIWMVLQNNTGNFGVGTASPVANLHVAQKVFSTGILKGFIYTGAVNINQTASTEIPSATFTTAGRQWATGALTTQREFLITQPTYSFVGASTITDAATFAVVGAPIKSTNASITNTHGVLVQAGAVSTATNSYGLTVNAQTGATNNYAAQFMGGNVGIGTASPITKLHISGDAATIDLLKLQNTNATNPRGYRVGPGAGATNIFGIYDDNASATRLAIDFSGNVGIGTITPASRLDVEGGVSIGSTYAGTTAAPTDGAIIEGKVGVGTSTPSYKLDVTTGTANDHAVNATITAISGTNYAGRFEASGASGANIGLYVTASAASTNWELYLGALASGANNYALYSAAAAKSYFAGSVGIGTTTAGYPLDVQGSAGVVNINTNGNMQAAGTVYTSDQMFKINVDTMQNALSTIRQLKPKTYYFDTLNFNGPGKFNFQSVKQYGFIAQEVETILPELVSHSIKPEIIDTLGNIVTASYTYRALNYNAFISILTKGVQELQQKNDSLQNKSNNQDSINASLQNQLNQLTAIITACCNRPQQSSIDDNQQTKSETISPTNRNNVISTDVKLADVQSVILDQNVPNPFAEQTTIGYNLPDNTAKAQMLFYNMQGKLIQSTELNQKGKGQLNVFASDLTNGVYTYTLVVDGKIIESKRMVKQ